MFTKKNARWLFVPLVSFLFLSACTAASTSNTATNATTEKTISVQGQASLLATPTQATLTLAVTTFNEDGTHAQSENTEKMNQTFATLEDLKIPKEQIKTTAYQITQRFNYTSETTEVAGYDVTNQIGITLTDLNLVSQVIDQTVKQGVNQMNHIQFSLSKEKQQELYQEALTQAVLDAKSKAETLAKAAKVKIKHPYQITESSNNFTTPRYETSEVMLEKSFASDPPIASGELVVEARVSVDYRYE